MSIHKLLYLNRRHDKDLFTVSTLREKHPVGMGGDWFSLCTFLEPLTLSILTHHFVYLFMTMGYLMGKLYPILVLFFAPCPPERPRKQWGPRGKGGGGQGLGYLVMMARWGGFMQAPMKSTTFSCLVCR